jgi:nucleoside-diphosphate-sugar epimerase
MRVLVTGAAGHIGRAVLGQLFADGSFDVVAADRNEIAEGLREQCETVRGDLRDLDFARKAMTGCDRVIHLAAIVGGIGNFHKLPYSLSELNASLYNSTMRAAIDTSVERFVYVSSSMVFENATEFPTTEEYLPRCPTPTSAYGYSKLTGEYHVRAAHDEFGLPFSIVRPSNAYGPGEIPRTEAGISHVITDLIAKVLDGQHPLPIFGSGEQTRTFTYVDDVAGGIVAAMAHPAGENEDFNISSWEEVTIAETARLIWEACGEDPERFELEHLGAFPVDVQRRVLSYEKAERLLGWKTKVELRDGIQRTVDWMKEHDLTPQPAKRDESGVLT